MWRLIVAVLSVVACSQPGPDNRRVRSLHVLEDGAAIVVLNGRNEGTLLRLGPGGGTQWSARIPGLVQSFGASDGVIQYRDLLTVRYYDPFSAERPYVIAAYELSSGALRWETALPVRERGDSTGGGMNGGPAGVGAGNKFVALIDEGTTSTFVVIDLTTGQIEWTRKGAGPTRRTLHVFGTRIVASNDYGATQVLDVERRELHVENSNYGSCRIGDDYVRFTLEPEHARLTAYPRGDYAHETLIADLSADHGLLSLRSCGEFGGIYVLQFSKFVPWTPGNPMERGSSLIAIDRHGNIRWSLELPDPEGDVSPLVGPLTRYVPLMSRAIDQRSRALVVDLEEGRVVSDRMIVQEPSSTERCMQRSGASWVWTSTALRSFEALVFDGNSGRWLHAVTGDGELVASSVAQWTFSEFGGVTALEPTTMSPLFSWGATLKRLPLRVTDTTIEVQ